jgi:hypothetical protein
MTRVKDIDVDVAMMMLLVTSNPDVWVINIGQITSYVSGQFHSGEESVWRCIVVHDQSSLLNMEACVGSYGFYLHIVFIVLFHMASFTQ